MHTGVGPVGGGGPGSPAPGPSDRPQRSENETVFHTILATMLDEGGRARKGALAGEVGGADKPSRAFEEKFRLEAEGDAAAESASAAAQALTGAAVASFGEGVVELMLESVDETIASPATDGASKRIASLAADERDVAGQPPSAAAEQARSSAAPDSARAEAAFVAGGELWPIEGADVLVANGHFRGHGVLDPSTGQAARGGTEGGVPGYTFQSRGATELAKPASAITSGETRLAPPRERNADAAAGGLQSVKSAARALTTAGLVGHSVRVHAGEQSPTSVSGWEPGSSAEASSGAAPGEGGEGPISSATLTVDPALWKRLADALEANLPEMRGASSGQSPAAELSPGEAALDLRDGTGDEQVPARVGAGTTFAGGSVREPSGRERVVAARTAAGETEVGESASSTDAPWGGKETAPDARGDVAPAAFRRDRESSASLVNDGSGGRGGVLATEATRAAGRRIVEANLGENGSARGPAAESGEDGASVEASGVGASSAVAGPTGSATTSRVDVSNGVGRENVLQQVREPFDDIVAELVRTPARGGVEQVSIRLRPEILGEVVMRIAVAPDGSVTARFFVEHAYVRQMIEQQLPELRASLSQHGLNLADASVFGGDAGLAWDDGPAADGTTWSESAPAANVERTGDGQHDDNARVADWEPAVTSIIDVRV